MISEEGRIFWGSWSHLSKSASDPVNYTNFQMSETVPEIEMNPDEFRSKDSAWVDKGLRRLAVQMNIVVPDDLSLETQ